MKISITDPEDVLDEDRTEALKGGSMKGVAFLDVDDHKLAVVIFAERQEEANERALFVVSACSFYNGETSSIRR